MYARRPSFKTPENPNVVIWRYLSFIKFASLIAESSLFFTGVTELRRIDPFEGTLTYPNWQIRQAVADMPEFWQPYANWDREFEEFLRYTVINCWHVNPTESVAMWKLYLARGEGVAIRSTFKRLATCFPEPSGLLMKPDGKPVDLYIGEIEYIDPRVTPVQEGDAFYRITHKDISFAYEQELRAVIGLQEQILEKSDPEKERVRTGIYVPVKLVTLIEAVVLPPFCPDWVKKLTEDLLEKYDVNIPVEDSRLKINVS